MTPSTLIPQDELEQLHADIGDGAVATVFGMLWAERAQAAAGDDLDGEGPLLQRSCLVGAWLGDILRDQQDGQVDRESGVQLSPGDLDETIITFLKLTEEAMERGWGGLRGHRRHAHRRLRRHRGLPPGRIAVDSQRTPRFCPVGSQQDGPD